MKYRTVLGLCWTLAIVAASVALLPYRAEAADEPLYPHAERETGPWGYIDNVGKIVIPPQFELAWPFSEGFAAVRSKGKYGFVDRTGHPVVEPQFDWFRPFQNGRASVRIGKAWTIIDGRGATLVPPVYAATWPFTEDRALVAIGPDIPTKWKFGAVDPAGRIVIEPQYDGLGYFSEGLASARRDGKVGYIDRDGKAVIPFQFERAFAFQAGRAAVFGGPDGKSGLIDKTGTLVATLEFATVSEFSEGLAVVSTKGPGVVKRYGAIDINGYIVIPPRFKYVGGQPDFNIDGRKAFLFSEGLLPVSEGQGFGYIDRQGSYVVSPRFLRASAFRAGLAVVELHAQIGLGDPAAKGQLAGLIDRSGQLVTPAIYDWIKIKPGGLSQVKFGKRLGYLDARGQPLTFSPKDIDDYVAQRREQLKPPPPPAPGTAVVAKAADTEYYLRLPDGMCSLDSNSLKDRKILDDLSAKGAAAAKDVGKTGQPLPAVLFQRVQKAPAAAIEANLGLFARCGELQRLRSDGDLRALETFGTAAGLRQGRPSPSANAGLVYISGFMCAMTDKDAPKGLLPSKVNTGKVGGAFQRLETGQSSLLPALAWDGLACYSAGVAPAPPDKAGSPPKAKANFYALLLLPDWMVQLVSVDVPVDSPDAFLQQLERQKALVKDLKDANFKK